MSGGLSAFDLLAPELPSGSLVLEASAGTGKTYTVAGLALRYIAEGHVPVESLMVVTFSRSATRELRHRVRDRLRDAVRYLADHPAAPPADDLLRHLAAADADGRRSRLETALRDFDTATITTIHGLATTLLTVLGTPLAGTLVEDQRQMQHGIAADVRVQAVAHGAPPGTLPWDGEARDIVRMALTRWRTRLQPEPDLQRGKARLRSWMAEQARSLHLTRSARERQYGHDDVLRNLVRLLSEDPRAAAYLEHLRARFRVGLVDEFQDTDHYQFQMLQLLLGGPAAQADPPAAAGAHPRSLVLVGDPKQAIYAFRGGDVVTYTTARAMTDGQKTLDVNHRSDRQVVQAVTSLFAAARFGHDIVAHAITPHLPRRCEGLGEAGVRLRVVHPSAGGGSGEGREAQRVALSADVAQVAVELLREDGGVGVERDGRLQRLRARDIAVLVRTNAEAALVQRALGDRGVPTVLNGVGSVFDSDAATHWLHLLRALDTPTDGGRTRVAGMTDLVGVPQAALIDDGRPEVEQLTRWVQRWARCLREQDVAAAYRQVVTDTRLYQRLLRRPDGPRLVADLEHLTELLHQAARLEAFGPASLLAWLEAQMADAPDVPPDAHARRLEGTADAVTIQTVHRAKGLQFPVVLCPFLWGSVAGARVPLPYHDDGDPPQVLLMDSYHSRAADARQEAAQEAVRVAYVAVTRAMHQAIVWWSWGGDDRGGPLASLLFAESAPPEDPAEVVTALQAHPAALDGTMTVEAVTAPPDRTPHLHLPVDIGEEALRARPFARDIDATWRRTSYSALVGAVQTDAPLDDPGDSAVDEAAADGADGQDDGVPSPTASTLYGSDVADDATLGPVVPLAVMPGGAEVGTAVHDVMEHADYTHPALGGHLRELVEAAAARHLVDLGDPEVVADGLEAALRTPLGGAADRLALVDLPRRDRRDELDFELPLAGGDRGSGRITLAAIADALAATLPADDPLAAYPAHLRDTLGSVEAAGYLGGRIDLVLRTAGGRHIVADHKTNRLAPPGLPLREGHYTAEAMAVTMIDSHYALQALLYAVAVHRLLRWRLPGYDPARHLDGIRYLFLRGMTGPTARRTGPVGMPSGVFVWRPPTATLLAVDTVLTGSGGPS